MRCTMQSLTVYDAKREVSKDAELLVFSARNNYGKS
jgi:hypothetical protein